MTSRAHIGKHPAATKPRTAGAQVDISILVGLLVASVIALGLFVAITFPSSSHAPAEKFFGDLSATQNGGFRMGDAWLGEPLETLKRKHPDVELAINRNGAPVAAFSNDGGVYTIRYVPRKNTNVAYQIRSEHTFEGMNTDQIIALVSKQYGPSSSTECTINAARQNKECRLKWWLNDGIVLDILTRSQGSAESPSTYVSITANDTFLKDQGAPATISDLGTAGR